MMKNIYGNISMRKIYPAMSLLILTLSIIVISACTKNVYHRGYLTGGIETSKIKPGMTQDEIINILGSPSMKAVFENDSNAYYYISDTVEYSAFFKPALRDRKILAIRFDKSGRAGHILHYDINDSKIINFVSDKTEVKGKELSVLEQLLGNIGRFDPAGVPGGAPGPGGL